MSPLLEANIECIKCGKGIPDAALYCCWCGKKQTHTPRKNIKRGNGTGSVYRDGNTWTAEITKGYRIEGDEKKRVIARKKASARKKKRWKACRRCSAKKSARKTQHSAPSTSNGSLPTELGKTQ